MKFIIFILIFLAIILFLIYVLNYESEPPKTYVVKKDPPIKFKDIPKNVLDGNKKSVYYIDLKEMVADLNVPTTELVKNLLGCEIYGSFRDGFYVYTGNEKFIDQGNFKLKVVSYDSEGCIYALGISDSLLTTYYNSDNLSHNEDVLPDWLNERLYPMSYYKYSDTFTIDSQGKRIRNITKQSQIKNVFCRLLTLGDLGIVYKDSKYNFKVDDTYNPPLKYFDYKTLDKKVHLDRVYEVAGFFAKNYVWEYPRMEKMIDVGGYDADDMYVSKMIPNPLFDRMIDHTRTALATVFTNPVTGKVEQRSIKNINIQHFHRKQYPESYSLFAPHYPNGDDVYLSDVNTSRDYFRYIKAPEKETILNMCLYRIYLGKDTPMYKNRSKYNKYFGED